MLIQQKNNLYQSNYSFYGRESTKTNKNKSKLLAVASGIGIASLGYVATGLFVKGNFDKSIYKKGLMIKDEILINKTTGEAFSGKIKSYVGKIGLNKVETQVFKKGVLVEKTYKNGLGQELNGFFYKNGKLCLSTDICKTFFGKKAVAVNWYAEKGAESMHMDSRKKGSIFAWARKLVNEEGWFSSKNLTEGIKP